MRPQRCGPLKTYLVQTCQMVLCNCKVLTAVISNKESMHAHIQDGYALVMACPEPAAASGRCPSRGAGLQHQLCTMLG